MGPLRVFLDANILFSAALGGPSFELLLELAEAGWIDLMTSRYCHLEAERNLARKRPAAMERLQVCLKRVHEVSDMANSWREEVSLPEKDAHVLSVAVAVQAQVFLTGDRKHFGPLMVRDVLPLRVCTVRDFLSEGPDELT